MAFLVRGELTLFGAAQGHSLNIILTREKDENLGLTARAIAAKKKKADLFLSTQCDADKGNARGTGDEIFY